MIRLLTLFICLLPIGLYAQSYLDFVKYNKQENICACDVKGEDFSDTILLNVIENDSIQDTNALACMHHCLGVYYRKNGNYLADIRQCKIAIEIREQYQDPLLWKSYRNIGYSYKDAGYYNKSIAAIEKAMQLNQIFVKNVMANIYLSFCHREMGEYKEAIEYGQKAVAFSQSDIEYGMAYNNIAVIYETMAEIKYLQLAVENARKAIQSFEKAELQDKVAKVRNNLGNILEFLEKYDEAISVYKKALQNYEQNELEYASILNNIAFVLNKQNKYTEAIKTLNKSLEIKQKYHDNKYYHPDYSPNYENLADSYFGLGKYNAAIQNYNKALDNLKDDPKSDNPYIYNKPDLLRVLDLKAQAALKNGDIDLAHNTYQELDDWINEFYKDLSTNQSKLTWIARAHTTYGHAIEVALAKNDKEKAFQYAEKAHAVLLWQSLSRQAARNLLSEADKEKMDDLNAQIRQANEQYRYGEITLDALRKLERERDNLEAKFDKKYPDYAQRKYQVETTSISDIQANITDEHTAFIEYYRTDETLYIFTITKNGIQITQENAAGLANGITDFVKNISSESRTETALLTSNTNTITRGGNINPQKFNLDSYHKAAHKLYQQLIPATVHSNEKINRLIIVPDREIGMLPFTALTTQATSGNLNKNTPFLIKKYSINYLYSAGSYLQLQQKTANQKYCFAGIAPVEYQVGNSEKLIYSEEELNKIKTLHWQWNREILMREQATKAAFERIVKQGYRTIQVSTHAVFDEQGGRIIFHDKIITQDEIDQLEINTHRLILSACETGVGTQNQGEGILSLGWNFAYKGVPSITMTHWSVNDNSTKNIMIEYHQNLHDGLPADQALRAAQITYLNDHTPSKKAFSPYYWAGIFHTGNVR